MSGDCKPRLSKAIFVVEHRRSIRLHSDGESKLGHERRQAPGFRLAVNAGAAGRENIGNCWNGKTCLGGMSVHGFNDPLTQRPRVRCFFRRGKSCMLPSPLSVDMSPRARPSQIFHGRHICQDGCRLIPFAAVSARCKSDHRHLFGQLGKSWKLPHP